MAHKDHEENRYSRQLYVLGSSALEKLAEGQVLIIGIGELGLEIARNLVLTGLRNIYFYDPRINSACNSSPASINESKIELHKVENSLRELQKLSPFVTLTILKTIVSMEDLEIYTAIVIAETGGENVFGMIENEIQYFNNSLINSWATARLFMGMLPSSSVLLRPPLFTYVSSWEF